MKQHLAIAAGIAGLLALAACASAPERRPPDVRIDAPMTWSSVGADTSQGDPRWWRAFANPTLDAVVEEALANNYDLVAASARVDQAAAIARVTRADGLPSLSARFNASRSEQKIVGIPIPGAPEVLTSRTNSFGVSLDTSWEIDLWGRVRKGTSAALADLEATWAELAALRLSVAAQTVKAWFAVTEAREQVRFARETVENYDKSAERVRARYERGVTTSLDLRLSLSSLASAQALLESRRQQLDRATRSLEVLLGRYPGGTVDAAMELPSVGGDVPAGLPSELLIRRPDLFAAERRFAAAEARASQARRAFFPRLTLTGSAGTLSNQLEDLTDGDFSVWSIAAGVVQPIFQGGRLIANLQQSNAVADQALARYAQSLLLAFSEVESALYDESALARAERYLSEAADQAEAARQLAERQYNEGLVDYITVLETQRRSLNARGQLIEVRRQRLDARVNLFLSLGGGFELDDEWTRFLEPNGGSR